MKQNSLAQKVLSDLSMTQSPTLQDSADVLVCDEDAFEDEMTPQEWRALGEWMDREEGLASIRTIRTQCSMDGVTTLEEAIEQLEAYITDLKELQHEGFTLCEPISDDYGYLYSRFAQIWR